MTDKEKLIALLDEWGVPYFAGPDFVSVGYGPKCPLIESSKVDGYCGFFTDFEFDAEGNFVKMGAWE